MNTADNILIAEALGFQKTDLGWYDSEEILEYGEGEADNTFDLLLFDTRWDWLLPACRKMQVSYKELPTREHHEFFSGYILMQKGLDQFDRQKVYDSVVMMSKYLERIRKDKAYCPECKSKSLIVVDLRLECQTYSCSYSAPLKG